MIPSEDKKPLVSILIPCYNSEAFLSETLDSCLAQTYPNIEMIIVDDGSTDRSVEIATEYSNRHDNISVHLQENKGAPVARNHAFEVSHGEYVMFLDADDLISPEKTEKQMEALIGKGERAVATCAWDRFYTSPKDAAFPKLHVYRDYQRGLDLLADLWQYDEMFGTTCYLVPRKLIERTGGWETTLAKNQDGEFFARVLMEADEVVFCPDAKLYYRSGDYNSVSKNNSPKKIEAILRSYIMYTRILEYEDTKAWRTLLAKQFAFFRYLFYATHPELSRIAKVEIKKLGVKAPPVGTKRVRQIARIIGNENFLRLRKLFIRR